MILADKLIYLRKKHQMTQEELAEKLNVSRQSISKWEGSLSTPDLNKIISLSQVFGVTTDYLLNDEITKENIESVETPDSDWYHVPLETARAYLSFRHYYARIVGLAVALFILSVMPLISLTADHNVGWLTENLALLMGLGWLLTLVTVGVGLLIWINLQADPYRSLETSPYELEFSVVGFLEKERENYRPTYSKYLIVAVGAILLSFLPLLAMGILFEETQPGLINYSISIWMIVIAAAVYLLVRSGLYWSSINNLLANNGKVSVDTEDVEGQIAGVYWPLIVAIFLGYSFLTHDWGRSWIIWPIAGVLFAATSSLYRLLKK